MNRPSCHRGRTVTVFTDVELFEVDQAGDGGGQVGQVVIGHAQLLQGLAVEELLWKHRGGETMEYYSLLAESHRPLREKVTAVQKVRTSTGAMHHVRLWKKELHLSAFL